MLIITYYAPIYFEAALGHSATKAGLDLLGLILSLVITNIVVGISVRKIGKYTPFIIAGPMIAAIGAGLLYTVDENTKFANVIGYEILCGVGIGMFMQLGMLAGQAEYAKEKEKMGRVMGVLTFIQMAGGVIGLAVAGAVFSDELKSNLAKCRSILDHHHLSCELTSLHDSADAPNVPAVVANSPTDIRNVVSGQDLANVVHAYTQSVRLTYICAVPVAGVAVICALFIKNRPLGPPKKAKDATADPEKAHAASTSGTSVESPSRKSSHNGRAVERNDSQHSDLSSKKPTEGA